MDARSAINANAPATTPIWRVSSALLGLLCVLMSPAQAQAAAEFKFRGLLDLGLYSSVDGRQLNRLTFGDSNLDPYRLRLFMDARINPALEVHVQSVLSEDIAQIRADGAYALWRPIEGRDLSLEAGKIPLPIGVYAPRTYSDKNALIGEPLMYQYHTSLKWNVPAASIDAQVALAGQGQFDPSNPYLAVVEERWWDTGAAFLGSRAPFEWSLAVMQGSPSWPAAGEDNTPGQTVMGRLGLVPVPGLRIGVSAADGTWMPTFWKFVLPAGTRLRDYRETSLMADAEFARGPFELRGEGVQRRWETYASGDLDVKSGYAEARYSLAAGAWLALRGETLRFADVTTSAAVTRPWDDDVDRFEAVVGYRFTQDVRAKLGAQRTRRHPWNAARIDTDLLIAGLSIRF